MLFHWILITRYDISYTSHSKYQGRCTSLTGLQNQYAGYSYNLEGIVSPLTISINPRGA